MFYETVIRSFLESLKDVLLVRLGPPDGYVEVTEADIDKLIEEWGDAQKPESCTLPGVMAAALMTRRRELLAPLMTMVEEGAFSFADYEAMLQVFGDMIDQIRLAETRLAATGQQLEQIEQSLDGHTGKVQRLIAYIDGRGELRTKGAEE